MDELDIFIQNLFDDLIFIINNKALDEQEREGQLCDVIESRKKYAISNGFIV
jgi:hypothetical protein